MCIFHMGLFWHIEILFSKMSKILTRKSLTNLEFVHIKFSQKMYAFNSFTLNAKFTHTKLPHTNNVIKHCKYTGYLYLKWLCFNNKIKRHKYSLFFFINILYQKSSLETYTVDWYTMDKVFPLHWDYTTSCTKDIKSLQRALRMKCCCLPRVT